LVIYTRQAHCFQVGPIYFFIKINLLFNFSYLLFISYYATQRWTPIVRCRPLLLSINKEKTQLWR